MWSPTQAEWEAFLYDSVAQQVVAAGQTTVEQDQRRFWVKRFAEIHQAIPCAHQDSEWLIVANLLSQCSVPGPVVELGAYRGGSTAKLSLVCRDLARPLVVCDSFQGLPVPDLWDAVHTTTLGRTKTYRAGDYQGTLAEVRQAVETWGCPEVCQYVEGWYKDTLPTLGIAPAVVVEDADLATSVQTSLRCLWPRMARGAFWLTHEAATRTILASVWTPAWWHQTLGQCPPLLIGAGTGMGPEARNLGWAIKET